MADTDIEPAEYKKSVSDFGEMVLKSDSKAKTVTGEIETNLNRRSYMHFWFEVSHVLTGGESYQINILKNNKVIHSTQG